MPIQLLSKIFFSFIATYILMFLTLVVNTRQDLEVILKKIHQILVILIALSGWGLALLWLWTVLWK